MEVNVTQQQGYTLAVTHGPLDDSATAVFRELLHPLFNTRGARLVVDIADSPRVTSEGLSAMVRLVTDANTRDARVVFAAPAPFVSGVFQVTRLDKFLEVVATQAEAVERMG